MSKVKELNVKINGFYSNDEGPFSFDDYVLEINDVKVTFNINPVECIRIGDLFSKKGIWVIRDFTIKMDPGNKFRLISKKIHNENEPEKG